MKAASFDYARASTVAEALALLASRDDATPIAGGQSLVPILAMRLARPDLLVDIAGVAELRGLARGDGAVRIGAAVRQREAERSEIVARDLPLLARALPWVGHVQTRNRGTVGGSVAQADPSAEIPLVAVALGARVAWAEPDGERDAPADAFFEGPMTTALPEGACIVAVLFPAWGGRVGAAFEEASPRRGDFALASAAAQLELGPDGRVARAALGVGGVHPVPLALPAIAERLVGEAPEAGAVALACRDAAGLIEPEDDLHADAAWRRRAAPALLARAVLNAARDAASATDDPTFADGADGP